MRRAFISAAMAWSLTAGVSHAQVIPDQPDPILRLKSPFAGPIWRADVDQAENFVALSGAYKALTVWSVANPNSPSVLRAPLRDEQRKRAHAVALSPDGDLAAYSVPPLFDPIAGARLGTSNIYVFRRSTGLLIYVLGRTADDIPTRPQAMRFSPDGKHLAAVLSSGCGLRVWSTENWTLAVKDDAGYGGAGPDSDRCCQGNDASRCDELPDTNDVRFFGSRSDDAWLITSGDTGVQIYERRGTHIARARHLSPDQIGLQRPAGLSLSPGGSKIAVGDRRDRTRPGRIHLRVAVLDAFTFAPMRPPLEVTEDVVQSDAYLQGGPQVGDMAQASLDRVAWLSVDGRELLFAGGVFPCEVVKAELLAFAPSSGNALCMVRWEIGDAAERGTFIPVGNDRVMDMVGMQRHSGVLVATQRFFGLLDSNGRPLARGGETVFFAQNDAADFRGVEKTFQVSPDAQVVEFEDYRSTADAPVRVHVDLRRLRVAAGDSGGRADIPADQDLQGQTITEWRNQPNPPTILGTRVSGPENHKDETYRSVSRLGIRKLLLLGSSEFLRLFSYENDKLVLLCREPITEDAYRVVLAPDATIAVAGHSDGTLRWYRIEKFDGGCRFRLLVSVHVYEARSGVWTWSAWQPSGYFARGLASRALMEWQTGNSQGEVELTPFEQLVEYYSWDEIAKTLEPPVVSDPKPARPDRKKIKERAEKKVVNVLLEPPPHTATTEKMRLAIKFDEANGWPKKLRLAMADGTPVPVTFAAQTARTARENIIVEAGQLADGLAEIEITLPASARRRHGGQQLCFFIDEKPDNCHVVSWQGEIATAEKRRLRAVLVGVARHDQPKLNLRFADNDVIDLARLFLGLRNGSGASGEVPVDYQEMQIDLLVSPFSDAGRKELELLAQTSLVKVRTATKTDIFAALEDAISDRADVETAPDDLFVFYFSGHGMTLLSDRNNETVFATKETTVESDQLLATGIRGTELLQLIRQIPGQKLVIFDACRSLEAGRARFDAVRVKMQFERVLDVHFFFSSDLGEVSQEVAGLAFDKTRPAARQGNSLFTYSMLYGLNHQNASAPVRPGWGLIKVHGLAQYLETQFFNLNHPTSEVGRLKAERNLPYVPTPQFIFARDPQANAVIRTLKVSN